MEDRIYRIYWIGSGLAKWQAVRRRKSQHPGNHDPEYKPVHEIKSSEADDYEPNRLRMPIEQLHLSAFQQAHKFLYGCYHTEFLPDTEGIKALLNALCYSKGHKTVLAYSRKDMLESAAFSDYHGFASGIYLVWLTEVARMGGSVYFVETVLDSYQSVLNSVRNEQPGAPLSDSEAKIRAAYLCRLRLAAHPTPDEVERYDLEFGRKTATRRTRIREIMNEQEKK